MHAAGAALRGADGDVGARGRPTRPRQTRFEPWVCQLRWARQRPPRRHCTGPRPGGGRGSRNPPGRLEAHTFIGTITRYQLAFSPFRPDVFRPIHPDSPLPPGLTSDDK
jgi:hypothetical protein